MKFTEIGRTGRPHGLKGEIKLRVAEEMEELLFDNEVFFVRVGNQAPVPYFLEEIRAGGALIAKFQGIENPEQARIISNCELLLPAKIVELLGPEKTSPYDHFIGYRIIDTTAGELAQIEEVLELPQHFLARITHEGREVLLPLHPDFILETDDDAKLIKTDLPEGLLEL